MRPVQGSSLQTSLLKTMVAIVALAGAHSAAAAAPQATAYEGWQDKTVPLEAFGLFPTIEGPRISPDGKWIAAKVRNGGAQVLAVMPVDAKTGKTLPIVRDGDFDTEKLGERRASSWVWIDPDHLLITVTSRSRLDTGDWVDYSGLASWSRITGKITRLGWRGGAVDAGRILWRSNSGPPHILLERYTGARGYERIDNPEVVDVDVETGKTTMVMGSNPLVSEWVADRNGVVRIGSSYDRTTGKVRILYRPNAESPMRTILNEVQDRFTDVALPDLILKDDEAYALSNKDGYRALYEYDLATMKMGDRIYGVDGYDIDDVFASPDGSTLEGVFVTEERSHWHFFDPRLKDISAKLEQVFGKGNVLIDTADFKRETILFTASETGQSPTLYLYSTVTKAVSLFSWQNETLRNARLNPVSVVHYPASDGKQIEAVVTMPRHRTGQKNLPLIVMPHGGPEARDSADWDPYQWAQAMAEYGYVVIQPNYRGSTGYGSEWRKAVVKNWGYRMQDDLNDAVTWLAGEGTVDPKRVCMMGWSYGGYAASRAAQRDGDKYRCAISGAGVHDVPAMVSYDRNYLGEYGAETVLGAAGSDLRDVSPGLHPEQYSIPILIVHGERDQRVPVSQSRDLVSRLKRAGKVEGRDFVYLEQPLNTHNLLREEDRIGFLKAAKAFLDAHNPP